MRLLSSRATFWQKRIFPVIWFGFLGVFVAVNLGLLLTGRVRDFTTFMPMLIFPVGMAVFGYAFMKKLVFDLVDEVEDDGDALIVKNGGRSDRIALADIMNVSYSPLINPPRVTLTLRTASAFGNQISFCAPLRFVPFASHPRIEELIRRIDASREQAARRHR